MAFWGVPAAAEEAGPDLVAVSFQTLDARPVIHEPVAFRLLVQNAGDVRVDHCGYRFFSQGNQTYAASGPCPLDPGTSSFVDFVWQPMRTGIHELEVVVNESPDEANLSNNRHSLTIDVRPASPLKLDQGYIHVDRSVENNTTTDRLWAVIDGVADHIPRHLHATFYENETVIGTAEAKNDQWSQANWYDKDNDTYGITHFLELNYRHDGTGPTNYTAQVAVDAAAAWSSRFTLGLSYASREAIGHGEGVHAPDEPPRDRPPLQEDAQTPPVHLELAAEVDRIQGAGEILFVIQVRAPDGDAPSTRMAVIDAAGYFVELDTPRDVAAGETSTFTVRVRDDPDRSGTGRIIVRAVSGESQSEPIFLETGGKAESLADRIAPLVTGPDGVVVLATGSGLLVFLAFLTTWTNEARRYLFLRRVLQAGIGVGLFSRIPGDKTLEHGTREEIHRLVSERPGIHYREILRTLHLSNGRLAHHLQTLEREGLLRSQKDGRLMRFFVARSASRIGEPLSPRQESILLHIRRRPGILQSDLAKELGVSRQALHQQVAALREAGLLIASASGRTNALYLESDIDRRICRCTACDTRYDRGVESLEEILCPSCGTV